MMTTFPKSLGVLFYAGAMLVPVSCQQADSYKVQVSGRLDIGNEWIEIHPESPLKAEKTFQYVRLELDPPFRNDLYLDGKEPNTGKGILMPDGDVINPEIEVIDQYGNTFKLVWGGAAGPSPEYGLAKPNQLPRDREYKTIRIRSPRPIKCKAIYWFCESSKDWP